MTQVVAFLVELLPDSRDRQAFMERLFGDDSLGELLADMDMLQDTEANKGSAASKLRLDTRQTEETKERLPSETRLQSPQSFWRTIPSFA